MQRLGTFLFAWRNWLFTAGLLGLLVACPPVLFLGSHRADFWLDLLGMAATLAGQGVRIAVIGQTRIASGGSRKRVDAERLITSGLLAHVRNPLYIGNLLVVAGLVLIHNNPWLYVFLLPAAFLGYQAIVSSEEAFLAQRFGEEYRQYCGRVRRWLPNLRGLRESLRQRQIDWRRVMLQEYGSIYLAVALPLALLIYEQLLQAPSRERSVSLNILWVLLLAATGSWVWFRRIKLAEVARRRGEPDQRAIASS